jgi:hypothetical protein
MSKRLLIRAAQIALRGIASEAERLDAHLKAAFDEARLPTPDRTRGQELVRTLRGYAANLDRFALRAGRKP